MTRARTIDACLLEVRGLAIEHAVEDRRELLIEDFHLRVSPGQITGLVGETGAGKSLSALATVGLLPKGLRPVGGWVTFDGVRVSATKIAVLRRHLGRGICLLFQSARGALNPFMRARAQVERALKLHGVPQRVRRERASELLQAVGLSAAEIGPKYAHQVSGGQAQRVAMAIALATEPRLLIADEPTTALDVTTERELIELLQRLCRERRMGLILITHNLALVSNVCDDLTLMHAGHVVEHGPAPVIFANPLHPYTVGLMGAIPHVDRLRDLVPLKGAVPRVGTLGQRCRFCDRCPHAWDRCHASVPPLYNRDHRDVRCFLYEEELQQSRVVG